MCCYAAIKEEKKKLTKKLYQKIQNLQTDIAVSKSVQKLYNRHFLKLSIL